MTQIYTGKGDTGNSSTFVDTNIPKDAPIFELMGSLDSLSVALGGARLVVAVPEARLLHSIQQDLVKLAGALAMHSVDDPAYFDARVAQFEHIIDSNPLDLNGFVFAGDSEADFRLHTARVVCRTAERRFVHFMLTSANDIPEKDLICIERYLNRLSDLLFLLGVYANIQTSLEI